MGGRGPGAGVIVSAVVSFALAADSNAAAANWLLFARNTRPMPFNINYLLAGVAVLAIGATALLLLRPHPVPTQVAKWVGPPRNPRPCHRKLL